MGQDRFNCRCPLCGDSKKRKNKRRGYFFCHDNSVIFKCHNCGVSKSLFGILETLNGDLARDFMIEKFLEEKNDKERIEKEEIKTSFKTDLTRLTRTKTVFDALEPIKNLDEFHPARTYLEKRKIPNEMMGTLRFVSNIQKFITTLPGYEETKMPAKAAIAIPFYSEKNELLYIQFRIMNHDSLRYFTATITPTENKIWGLDRIDWNKRVYVCEGPFDAMFIDNALAVAGASILSILKYLKQHCRKGYTLVFDRDYTTNAEIYGLLCRAIDENESVLLYDRSVVGKDINDIVLETGWTRKDLMDYLERNTKTGLAAKLELSSFKSPQKDQQAWHANRVAHR